MLRCLAVRGGRQTGLALAAAVWLYAGAARAEAADESAMAAVAAPAAAPLGPDLLRKYGWNYFLFGGVGHPERQAKFQVSVRYGLIALPHDLSVNFAFTQTSWWSLYSDSSPFVESDYAPEAFLEWRRSSCLQPVDASFSLGGGEGPHRSRTWQERRAEGQPVCDEEDATLSALAAGFLHQSNGLAGTDSRGWNRVYGQATFTFRFGSGPYQQRAFLQVIPRLWWIASQDDTDDPHMVTYYGPGELRVILASPATAAGQQVEVEALARKGWLDNSYGAVQTTLQVRPWPRSFLSPWLIAQWWYGHGQRLLRYDQRDSELRFGLILHD